MSPSWRDRLLVGLAPERVAAVVMRRGWRPVATVEGARDCPPAEGPAWSGAVAALEDVLGELPQGGEASVVLSNQFVRYLEVPWTPGVIGDRERGALAADGFRTVHGDTVAAWKVVVDRPRFGLPAMAAAVDGALVDALSAVLAKRRWRLVSARPYLVAALDRCQPALTADDGGFAVVEPGCVTALFRRGEAWTTAVNRRIRRDNPEEAASTLVRCIDADALQGGSGGVALLAPGLRPFDVGTRPVRRVPVVGVPAAEDPWRTMAWSAA